MRQRNVVRNPRTKATMRRPARQGLRPGANSPGREDHLDGRQQPLVFGRRLRVLMAITSVVVAGNEICKAIVCPDHPAFPQSLFHTQDQRRGGGGRPEEVKYWLTGTGPGRVKVPSPYTCGCRAVEGGRGSVGTQSGCVQKQA